jgi:hypothetical protein
MKEPIRIIRERGPFHSHTLTVRIGSWFVTDMRFMTPKYANRLLKSWVKDFSRVGKVVVEDRTVRK